MLAHEHIKTGKITAIQHDSSIHLLSEMIHSQDHYETICDSLGVPPEYGPMAKPRCETVDVTDLGDFDKVLHLRKKLFV